MRTSLMPALLALLAAPAATAADPPRTLLFRMELVDTSGEGPRPEHAAWLDRVTAVLGDRLAESGHYAVQAAADSPVAARLPASIDACGGCALDLGREAGAALIATGFIHKISSLVLNIRLILWDVRTGEPVRVGIADIRGDNERSWRRGVEWLVRHRILAGPP